MVNTTIYVNHVLLSFCDRFSIIPGRIAMQIDTNNFGNLKNDVSNEVQKVFVKIMIMHCIKFQYLTLKYDKWMSFVKSRCHLL